MRKASKGMFVMRITDKSKFISQSMEALEGILDVLYKAPDLSLSSLPSEQTALLIVDMVNGFVREGALMSSEAEKIIPDILDLMKQCKKLGIQTIAFGDNHTDESPEFNSYPPHCIQGTSESEIVDEIKEFGNYHLISKNSTNGFLEEEFQQWLRDNSQVEYFIVTGDCTDICVQQLAITLKTWFNKQNKKSRIIVPINAVATYDFGLHNGNLTHVMALYNMVINGVEVVVEVK